MKPLDMDKIAKALGGERKGKVSARSGYFGALDLAAEVQARFRVPATGGRATDPRWTERRQVPLAPETLRRLEELAARISEHAHLAVEPLQLAGILLERTAQRISREDAEELVLGENGSRRF